MTADQTFGVSFDALVETSATSQSERPGFALVKAWLGLELPAIRRDLTARLSQAGIDEAADDARFLLAHVLAPHSLAQVMADPALTSWQAVSDLADLAAARLRRVPLSQVLGSKPFWTLDLKVSRDVLTPRADTEALVEAVLARCDAAPRRLLDLGTGSGAILLALLSERPEWTGLGVDLSEAALAVARQNVEACGLSERASLTRGRWGEGLEGQAFDLIVSNPPYIVSEILAGLEPEVRDHEPALALDGGADGLTAYRAILGDVPRLLRPGGWLAFEIGHDQAASVMSLVRATGLTGVECLSDLGGNDRVVFGQASFANS